MKKNNKGITIIEMIVSISLISIVLIFLLRLLLTIKEMDDKSLSMINYEEKTSLIMKNVQDSIKDLNNCQFTQKDTNNLIIDCANSVEGRDGFNGLSDKQISVQVNNKKITITNCIESYYDDYDRLTCPVESWTFVDALQVSGIKNTSSSNLNLFTIDVVDDKNNTYPIEISYYSK